MKGYYEAEMLKRMEGLDDEHKQLALDLMLSVIMLQEKHRNETGGKIVQFSTEGKTQQKRNVAKSCL